MNATEWLSQLIAFDTTSYHSNLALIERVREWLEEYAIPANLSFDSTGKKANLFATLPAFDGQMQTGGLILSGHTDVVPVEGQKWESDPFQAKVTADRIYGRGACDMKGFIAVVLSLIPEFKQQKLAYPLHLALSYDEEVGCQGAPVLIADFESHGIQPAACIVGEPTDMQVVTGHKGIHVFHCRIEGRAAHSSLTPAGCNAIEYAAELITRIRQLAEDLKQNGPHDPDYDVSFTSLTTNQITGGIAQNIIPDHCEFWFEFRNLPSVKPAHVIEPIQTYIDDQLLPKMQREYPEATIQLTPLHGVPGLEAPEEAQITQWARHITQDSKSHKVSYATEAGLFQRAGIPTIVCGPGNIGQAHRANEFVLLEQLERCKTFLRGLIIQPKS